MHRSRPRPLLSYRSRLPWPTCDTPGAPPHSSRHQIIVVALRMLLSAVAPPYRCLHWGLTATHAGPLHAVSIVRSAMRSTHDVKGFRMVEYNDDAARYLSLLSNNSIIEQQFNDIAPPAPATHAQRNVVTSLSSRIERSRIEINGSDRMKRNHKPSIIIMKQ